MISSQVPSNKPLRKILEPRPISASVISDQDVNLRIAREKLLISPSQSALEQDEISGSIGGTFGMAAVIGGSGEPSRSIGTTTEATAIQMETTSSDSGGGSCLGSNSQKKRKKKKQNKKRRSKRRKRSIGEKKLINYQQSNLSPYLKNGALKPIQHPLEENIFTGLLITLVAVALAFVLGIPVLFIAGVLLIIAIIFRYISVIIEGCVEYFRFVCANRTRPADRTVPYILPRDRLAFANDVRWLGDRGSNNCQSLLHTVLVFEGYMELNSFRNSIQSRVLDSETIDGDLAYPRLMAKLVPLFGGHRWENDPEFDIKNHIFLGSPNLTTETQIQQHLSFLLTQCLPTNKPLWEIHLFPNYGSQRDTLAIVRVHQCLADGMTLVRILLHSLADQQQLHVPQRPNFASLSFGFNVLRSLIVGPLTLFLWFCLTSRDRNFFSRPLKSSHSSCKNSNNHKHNSSSTASFSSSSAAAPTLGNFIRKGLFSKKDVTSVETKQQTQTLLLLGSSSVPSVPFANSEPTKMVVSGTRIDNNKEKYEHEDQQCEKSETTAKVNVTKKKEPRRNVKLKSKNKSHTTNSNCCKNISTQKLISSNNATWKIGWSANLTVTKIARVKQIMRSSLNDVLLSAAAGSVRTYLQSQGIAFPGDIKVVIPVDLRNDISSPKISKRLGCKVASVLAAIPAGIEAAIPRLWATRQRLDEVKASADPVVAYGATAVFMNLLPQKLGSFILNKITDKASLQFCNLAGPTSTLLLGGIPLKSVYPIYPPTGKIRVAITVFTYSDQVHVTVVSHKSMPNFSQSLLSGMSQQVDQLSSQLSHRRVPGESRRSARNASTINTEITKPPTKQIHFQLQVVQEELQELSHKLDHQEPFDYSISCEEEDSLGLAGELLPPQQLEIRSRLKTLKTEFTDLMGELRRRTSIVEGVNISFEDEEDEEQFRKPRKRALSVVSTSARRNSFFTPPRMLISPEPSSHHSYSSDDNLSEQSTPPMRPHQHQQQSQPQPTSPELHLYSPSSSAIRHSSSSIRTTAV